MHALVLLLLQFGDLMLVVHLLLGTLVLLCGQLLFKKFVLVLDQSQLTADFFPVVIDLCDFLSEVLRLSLVTVHIQLIVLDQVLQLVDLYRVLS